MLASTTRGIAVALCAALIQFWGTATAEASHYRGGSVSYSVNDAGLLTVEAFTLWRSDFISTPSFAVRTGSGGTGTLVGNMSLVSSTNPYATGTELGGAAFVVRRDVFTFNLASAAAGTYYARYSTCCRVSGINNAPEDSFSLEVKIVFAGVGAGLGNSGPSILPATIDIIGRTAPYTQNLNSVDPDLTPVNHQFVGGTLGGGSSSPHFGPSTDIPGIALDAPTGTVSVSAANTGAMATGRWVYKVRVEDGSGATAERDVLVVAQDLLGNSPPVLASIGPKVVAVGSPLTFNVSGTDADAGNGLTLRARLLPAGATFAEATASSPTPVSSTFSWTPVSGDEGVYRVYFEVFDDATTPLIASEIVEITVTGFNNPPVLDPVGNKSVANGGTLSFAISGSDLDLGQTLSYSAFFLPAGAIFDSGTQTFTWTPSPSQYDSVFTGVTFRVTDDGVPNLFDDEAINITVGAGNQAPEIDAIPPQTVVVGQLLTFDVVASDPNGAQTLTLTPGTGGIPLGASFPGATGVSPVTGTFSWTPALADVGSRIVRFRVEDSGTPILSFELPVTIDVVDAVCGNGTVEFGEECDDDNTDDGDCCSSTCQFEALGDPCADDGEACTEDVCDGAGACTHPAGNSGTLCRPAAGECDVEESCDGVSASCPADDFVPAATPCTDDGETCTEDVCDGAGACTHPAGNAGALCRPAAGECDVEESCDGVSASCPADDFVPAATPCTDDGEACTEDVCDGAGACTHPAGNAGALCRPAAGECDVEESCDGVSASCPVDDFVPAATPCTDDGETCTEDVCDGAGACTHPAGNAGALCRPAAGECDVEESCDGVSAGCPVDDFVPAATPCTDDGETCTEDVCDGAGACTHPAGNAGAICRSQAGECDVAEICDGVAASCPANEFASAGSACGDPSSTQCTAPDTCDGAGACSPNHMVAGTSCDDGEVCTAPDECNGAGICTTSAVACPACEVCVSGSGCTPASELPCDVARGERSVLFVRNSSNDLGDVMVFRWTGRDAMTEADYGDPLASTGYELCVYDDKPAPGSPRTLVQAHAVSPGGTCNGRPCWRRVADGFLYSNRRVGPQALQILRLRRGAAGRARVYVRAKGPALGLTPHDGVRFFAQSDRVTVVLLATGGRCMKSEFPLPYGLNNPFRFRDRD